ncbi:protein-glutamate O-methyltransferase CheR [uncultured Tateyamaria sp.]|uniref:CheR family methyltransferase n=1 Tax=uncultured Tateyamaria sp. TaxID=455651 RepID=UPI002631CF0B|nr:protein-glutamate O-methyltransferase [uncultured Tateyamaria sp.]
MDDQVFEALAALAHRESGIKLAREKKLMVQSRLRHRLRALNLDAFSDYSDHVLSDHGANERRFMISALTTNVSHFFREAQHFDLMSDRLMPEFKRRAAQGERIRIWSAGCSNGQEAYSIAMHLLSQEPTLATADLRILGTDIDPRVIEFARVGQYSSAQLKGVSPENIEQFTSANEGDENLRTINENLKAMVSFQELNLLSDWPMRFPFDAIFCRNVVIYFDQPTQERLWPRFSRALARDGLFFLGHSERILAPSKFDLKSVGPTAYLNRAHSFKTQQ